MDKRDRENLKYILARVGDGSIDEWLETIDEEDLEYTLSLLQQYRTNKDKFERTVTSFFG